MQVIFRALTIFTASICGTKLPYKSDDPDIQKILDREGFRFNKILMFTVEVQDDSVLGSVNTKSINAIERAIEPAMEGIAAV